jgi:hypothetical protein
LPDFWLPGLYFRWNSEPGCWFEVKGVKTEAESSKIEEFALAIKQPVCVATGAYFSSLDDYCLEHWFSRTGESDDMWWDQPLMFMVCRKCRKTRIQYPESNYAKCDFCDTASEFVWDYEGIHPALLAARSARFEHGENGK